VSKPSPRAHTPQKQLLNLYASPSILITGRSTSAGDLIRSISPDRLLVESDTHDARLATRLVWGACEWMARCRGWRLEGLNGRQGDAERQAERVVEAEVAEWELGEEEEEEWEGKEQEQRWLIKTVERNWARFMRIVE
jgi:Tat protein secretion system quality control protein TatD with DNase activity